MATIYFDVIDYIDTLKTKELENELNKRKVKIKSKILKENLLLSAGLNDLATKEDLINVINEIFR